MLADSIPAAHVALTETSAHPVSTSSFTRRLHDPTPLQKRLKWNRTRHIRRNWSPQCPLGVIRVDLSMSPGCPVRG